MPYMTNGTLDATDQSILDILIADSRASLREIGARIGLSAPAVRDRIRRLEDQGVIEGFTVRVNRRALGFALEAVLRVEPLPGRLRRVETILQAMPEITECAVVTGEDCFVARLVLRDIADLDRLLAPLHDIAKTRTSIVHRQPVPPRAPPFRQGP